MQTIGVDGYSSWQTVTPSDSTPLTFRALLINVTVAGNIVLKPSTGATGVTITLPVGLALLPLSAEQGLVMATGNTATSTITALA